VRKKVRAEQKKSLAMKEILTWKKRYLIPLLRLNYRVTELCAALVAFL
jgi:hypothetical protein